MCEHCCLRSRSIERTSSTIAKALQKLRDLLDAKADGFGSSVNRGRGETIAPKAAPRIRIRTVVGTQFTPLAAEVKDLAKEVRDAKLLRSLGATTAKGFSYEEEVILQLQSWGNAGLRSSRWR